MALTLTVLGTALVVLVGGADLRWAVRQNRDDRRTVLARQVGTHVTIIDRRQPAIGPVTGLVRGISRQHVRLRTIGSEVRVPITAISEVWDGRRLLQRW